jgi:hypothetical protein
MSGSGYLKFRNDRGVPEIWHRRRLLRLLRALEGILSGETGQNFTIHDHYVARLADIFDMLALALRVSRA